MALDTREDVAVPLLVHDAGGGEPPFAVVVAMKPQLRGRLRRNVETLLEMGARVTVLAVRSRKDFYVGLEHPLLTAELATVNTFRNRFEVWARHDRLRREYVDRLRLDRVRRRHLRTALRLRYRPVAMVRHLWTQPRFRAPYGRDARPFPQGLMALGIVAAAPFVLLALLGHSAALLAGGALRLVGVPDGTRRIHRFTSRTARSVLRLGRPVLRGSRRVLWQPAADAFKRARSAALERVRTVLTTVNRVESFLRFWAWSARRIRSLRPDLVVSSDLPGLVGASRAARSLGIRQVHDCHELYLESTSFRPFEQRFLAPIERRHMRRSARVVAVNKSIADEYDSRYGVRPLVVRNCAASPVGEEPRDIRDLAGLPKDARVVLYQGGFSVGRGLDVCLAAMRDLPADVHLVLLGYGPLETELRVTAAATGLAERVHVVPAVPPAELLAYTSSATLGLIPYQPVSKNNYYSLPNKCFEYTSVGLPLVVSDLPELRRVALDGGCGVTYDPFDPASLTEAIRTVIDPANHERFCAGAQAYGAANDWTQERRILVRAFDHGFSAAPRSPQRARFAFASA